MSKLNSLQFDNLALRRLPVDPIERNYVRTVNGACFSRVMPTPVTNPKLVAYSLSALSLLDLPEDELQMQELVEYFSGNKILPGSEPAAHCYCGHQFGYFSGQLGDGAAIYLGEVINSKNERWEIQLKGAGLTPYSRTADGRKVLRSSIREFLCSEAMHFLGLPTTRAGTCITSDSKVIRDIFYDNRPKEEFCSIVLRIAPSFIRFGSFEIFKTLDQITGRVGPSVGRHEILYSLLDYVIETFYPEIHKNSNSQLHKYTDFYKEVVLRTARLVALWQCVGFCHGVLNTDNMSILGLTIDYGPFGFLDMYDPNHVCNGSDDGGRYTFIKQPEICFWNLRKFAEAIQQALPLDISAQLLEIYEEEFKTAYQNQMRKKLGLMTTQPEDENFIQELFDTMEKSGADFTNTFLCFSLVDVSDVDKFLISLNVTKEKIIENCYSLEVLLNTCDPNLSPAQLQTFLAIASANPEIIEQLGRAGIAIKRVLSQLEKAESLKSMTEESKNQNDKLIWTEWLNKYKARIEKDMQSYDGDAANYYKNRLEIMKANNPRFILRNYIAQEAIEKAENGDYAAVQKLVKILENPYDQSYIEAINQDSANAQTKEDICPSTGACSTNSDRYCFKILYKLKNNKAEEETFNMTVTFVNPEMEECSLDDGNSLFTAMR
ncbi:protein adenylyltransferase SelO, mitochondrial [Caerostris darwini]|uniref:Selenoprotein O n=1 Tax=Caerostris darwini TaxID=1538125 RepID=A0AAV4WZE0_9ARAC|nr:protein adenylyltransferase SelO, mitochondrial [Caerostris darwini]